MILRSIRVEGWQCFADAIEVGPLFEGLNVIHGPNGSGKSTLMMALVRGLFDSHGVGGEQIKLLRPWGRSLIPKVTIEFDQDGVQYRLQKQFLTSPSAQLSRLENGRYIPLAESRAADDQAREILAGEAPGRGITDQRHWGWAQILWAAQGNLHLDRLSDGTRATIQDALGVEVSGPGADTLEKKIGDAYTQFFTPGGKLKTGASAPAVVGLVSQLEAAQGKRSSLQARLAEFEDASRRIEDLRHEAAQAEHSESDLTALSHNPASKLPRTGNFSANRNCISRKSPPPKSGTVIFSGASTTFIQPARNATTRQSSCNVCARTLRRRPSWSNNGATNPTRPSKPSKRSGRGEST